MKKIIVIIFNLFVLFQVSLAQQYSISGYIQDAKTGEKLINANVFIKNTTKGTITNSYGFYNLTINNQDTIIVIASYIGYKSQEIIIKKNQNQEINFFLQVDNEIDEITVTATTPINRRTEMGVLEIPIKQLNLIPTIGAEPDIMKAYQLMPGIQSGNEGSSGLYVRGGSPDQNLILLDDVPLYYVNHLGGFISVFNNDIIKKVKLTKSGFPARYGGRLSSVMDIRMKDGDMNEYHGNINIGIVSSKISFEGPIQKHKSSFIISARVLTLGLLWKPVQVFFPNEPMGYNFWDLNAKFNYKINNKNRIFYSFYYGDDNVNININEFEDINSDKNKLHSQWGNLLNAIRWNHQFSQKLFLNTTLAFTRYRYFTSFNFKDETEHYKSRFTTGINDYFLKFDFEYNLNNNYNIKFGSNAIYHNFSPKENYIYLTENNITLIDTTIGYNNITPYEIRAYCENEFNITQLFSANIGLHSSFYSLPDTNYFSLEPRILLNFSLFKNTSLKMSYAAMMQKVHLLTSNTVSIPMDIWLPATKQILPSKTNLYSAGIFISLKNGLYEFSTETYYKTSDNLISFKEGATYSTVTNDYVDKLELNGIGKSYGIELLLQKKQGKITGWLAYTYSKTELQFANLNFGKPFPFKYDRRHDFSIVLNYKLNENINISGNWVFGTGYPYSLPIGNYSSIATGFHDNNEQGVPANLIYFDETIFIYPDRNSFRMRAYHRLDLGLNFSKEKKHGTRTWTISIYNAYNRQNPYFYYTDIKDDEVKLYQQSLFPIIPSISYSFKF